MTLSTSGEDSFLVPPTLQTSVLGEALSAGALPGALILLTGPMGIGKTEWVRGMARGLGLHDQIKSPTYLYLQEFFPPDGTGGLGLLHADWDRVETGAEDLEDALLDRRDRRVACVEWGEKLPGQVVASFVAVVHVRMAWEGPCRRIEIGWKAEPSCLAALSVWRESFGAQREDHDSRESSGVGD